MYASVSIATIHLFGRCSKTGKHARRAEDGQEVHLAHGLPVIEDTLGEGLAGGGSAQGASEAEGLDDGQVGLQVEDGRARPLSLLEDVAALLVQHRVDASQGLHTHERDQPH